MKIIYTADVRLPTEKGHGFQIMKTCQALAKKGNEIVLVVPSWNKSTEDEIFSYYGVEKCFRIQKIPALNMIRLGPVGFALRSRLFAYNVARKIRRENSMSDTIIYTRDETAAAYLVKRNAKVFYEIHDVRKSKNQLKALSGVRGIIAISNGLKKFCLNMGVSESKICVVPDSVDLNEFNIPESKEDARKELGLPLDKKIALYSGHLYSWKGANILAQAAAILDDSFRVVFVGGTPWDLESFRAEYGANSKIIMVGHKPHSKLPPYFRAADVLVLPNSAREDISRLYTSPIKLFDYMASGRPIVASDLPSIREILSEKSAVFCKPDDPEALAQAIKSILENGVKADILSHQALSDVKKYSWEERARKIIEFIQK